jgi:hypothetical protein
VFYLYTISIVLEVVSDDRKFSASVNSIIINLVFLEGGGGTIGEALLSFMISPT